MSNEYENQRKKFQAQFSFLKWFFLLDSLIFHLFLNLIIIGSANDALFFFIVWDFFMKKYKKST